MKINMRFFASAVMIVIFISASSQDIKFNKVKWESEVIAPGLRYLSAHTALFDTLLQNINILEVDTRRRHVTLIHDPDSNKTVPAHVSGTGALAAVNAGFFNIRNGGSVTYIRVDGLITDNDTALKWTRNQNMNGALLIDLKGNVFIEKAATNNVYDSKPEFEDVLVTGCLLVDNSAIQKMPSISLVINRHPRTCAGIKSRRKILLVTVDGRTDQSIGVTLPELALFMKHLGCSDAVNLDGGGSTTMWIKGKPHDGVVNMPCDNKKFDHLGARAVANVVAVK